jgi:hypothetical protein
MVDVNALNLRDLAEAVSDKGEADVKKHNMLKNGATEREAKFLLIQRIELNALTSGQLVAFIEQKLRNHGIAKVVPDLERLADVFKMFVRSERTKAIIEKTIEEECTQIEVPIDLATQIQERLQKDPTLSWDQAIKGIAEDSND